MNYMKMAEARLLSYNDLKASVDNDIKELDNLKSILEIKETQPNLNEAYLLTLGEIKKNLHFNRNELERLDDSIASVSIEPYGEMMELKYINRISEEKIAELLNCDISTIRRNKRKLLKRIAIRLYGRLAI